MVTTRVLQIGIDPAAVDFTPWSGQDADTLRARITAAELSLREAGFDVTVCLLPDDGVEIGSGLRTSHEYTVVFERVVNAVIACQQGVPLCFNDSPETTLDAVRRAIGGEAELQPSARPG